MKKFILDFRAFPQPRLAITTELPRQITVSSAYRKANCSAWGIRYYLNVASGE